MLILREQWHARWLARMLMRDFTYCRADAAGVFVHRLLNRQDPLALLPLFR